MTINRTGYGFGLGRRACGSMQRLAHQASLLLLATLNVTPTRDAASIWDSSSF